MLSVKSRVETSFDRFFVHHLGHDVLAHGKSYEHGFTKKHNGLRDVARGVEFPSVFRASSQKFKILAIPDALVHGKSYEHGFTKKHNSHILCAKSRRVEFRSIFHAPSHKFKILTIPDELAHGKLYEHGFTKKM
ncbi:hypothetical protein B296_00050986 [Ensete ventricosum]|uniref:Uncharacterized protein n=1 Tax=Ensete ventricosum TaxID=4639 RepID=A0A426XII6_ENSVE|nr:hypothetical protein B296_00050986 [Ensete ventricosum]